MKKDYIVYTEDLIDFKNLIRLLNKGGIGFLAIVDSDNKLVGIVTDGDIRRAILSGASEVESIVNYSPLIVSEELSKEEIIRKLKQERKLHAPVVDNYGILKNVFLLNSFTSPQRENKVVIMVGGIGARLGELTKEIPKPMLEVKGKPILEHIVSGFREKGFSNFIFCVHYKSEVIENYFGTGEKYNVKIDYVLEEKRMGTAGAISLIEEEKISSPFFVVNGDVLANVNYNDILDYYTEQGLDGLMCVKQLSSTNPYAVVEFDQDQRLTNIVEKPTSYFCVNSGIYLLNNKLSDLVPKNEFLDMPELFEKGMKNNINTKVYKLDDDWIDIGKPSDYHSIK